MSNGDFFPQQPSLPLPRDPGVPPPDRGFREPGGGSEVDPTRGFLPPVLPGINQPPSQIFIPDAPAGPAPTIGAILRGASLPAAIGSIAIILIERVAGVLQERAFRDLEDETEAEIEMIRGRIEAKQRIRDFEVEPGGDLAIPPIIRTPGLFDRDRFPFPEPEPLGDDPLPDIRRPIPAVIVPFPDPDILAPEPATPKTPAPVVVPRPSLPGTAPASPIPLPKPAPTTRPGTAPRPTSRPGVGFPAPGPSAFPTFRFSPLPAPSSRPKQRPKIVAPPTTIPQTPVTPLTDVRPVSVPSELARPSNCPPCPRRKKDDKEEPRSECFKVLTKQALFPSQDETFNWVEIDCFTGKEL